MSGFFYACDLGKLIFCSGNKTVRLSKRGWNNVMIFACLAMIIIFNTMSNKLVDNAEGESGLILPPQSMILTLEYPSGTIERLGRNWRVTLDNDSLKNADQSNQQFAHYLTNQWLMLQGETQLTQSDETGYRVVIWLAGEQNPIRFWIQPQAQLITNILTQQTWYLTAQQIAQLSLSPVNIQE